MKRKQKETAEQYLERIPSFAKKIIVLHNFRTNISSLSDSVPRK